MQLDFILLFVSTLQKLILRYVNAISSDMFSLSFKNFVISHQNGCMLEHSQNKWILDSVEELQKSHKLDSIDSYFQDLTKYIFPIQFWRKFIFPFGFLAWLDICYLFQKNVVDKTSGLKLRY